MKYEYFIYLKIMEITLVVLGIICIIVVIKGIILMRQCKKTDKYYFNYIKIKNKKKKTIIPGV
jgi:hypothetical protein